MLISEHISRSVKHASLVCLLPVALQVPNLSAATEDYTGSLSEMVKNGSQSAKDELCLLSDKVPDSAVSKGIGGKLKQFGGVLLKKKDELVSSMSSKSVYCGKNIINVMLQTGEEIDLAVVQAADSIHSALIALDYKEEDLRELARIKKAELGTRFTKQAMGDVGNNSKVVEQWATELSKAVDQRKDGVMGPEAEKALGEAVGNLRGAIFHQTKAMIGAYFIKEFVEATPGEQILALGVHYESVGLTDDFILKLPPRVLNIAGNLGRTLEAMTSTEKVLDDDEMKAIIEAAGTTAIDRERKASVAAAKRIEKNSTFAELPSAQDQMKLAQREKEPVAQSRDSSSSPVTDSGGSKTIDTLKKFNPFSK